MTLNNYINEMKRDFGFTRCQEVPDEMIELMLFGEESSDNDEELPII